MSAPVIRPGLKFTSVHFSATAEVYAVDEAQNTADIMLTPSDGFSWVVLQWCLKHLRIGFERGEYTVIEPNEVNIGII